MTLRMQMMTSLIYDVIFSVCGGVCSLPLPGRYETSADHRHTDRRNVLLIYIFHGWVLLRRGSKSKSLQQFNAVTSLWSLASFLRLENFCPQAKKMCFLLLNRAISFMNFRATATVGTWVAHLNGCRTESRNTFPNL